ncbi:MAG: 6-carboxytetrahydropterin synthase QueD [Myxococcales bacterium]|nr:6-carboxytetrahydropterin synthase QueD [Myxococcales bacterium]
MRTEIERTFRIEAAHRLPHVPEDHKCARLHGHSFHITLHVAGPVDARLGWVIDFAEIDEAFAPLFKQLDHHYLNEVEGLDNPTSELLARWVLERVVLPAPAMLRAVTVAETCMARCTVHAEG